MRLLILMHQLSCEDVELQVPASSHHYAQAVHYGQAPTFDAQLGSHQPANSHCGACQVRQLQDPHRSAHDCQPALTVVSSQSIARRRGVAQLPADGSGLLQPPRMSGSGGAPRGFGPSPASAVHPRGLLREGVHPAVVIASAEALGTLNVLNPAGLPLQEEVHPAVVKAAAGAYGMAKWL